MVGIYTITNTLSGKVYVGQSKNITKRWAEHRRVARLGSLSQVISQALRKYGVELFRFEVVQECSADDLDAWEQAWLDWAFGDENGTYNTLRFARSKLGNKPTPEARANMCRAHAARTALQTHCPSGHLLAETAIRWGRKSVRYCKSCAALRNSVNSHNPVRQKKRAEYRRVHGKELAAKQRAYMAKRKLENCGIRTK